MGGDLVVPDPARANATARPERAGGQAPVLDAGAGGVVGAAAVRHDAQSRMLPKRRDRQQRNRRPTWSRPLRPPGIAGGPARARGAAGPGTFRWTRGRGTRRRTEPSRTPSSVTAPQPTSSTAAASKATDLTLRA